MTMTLIGACRGCSIRLLINSFTWLNLFTFILGLARRVRQNLMTVLNPRTAASLSTLPGAIERGLVAPPPGWVMY
jgi:hypothetical protein